VTVSNAEVSKGEEKTFNKTNQEEGKKDRETVIKEHR